MPIRHDHQSPLDDNNLPDQIQPSHWNHDHVLVGLLAILDALSPAANSFLGFDAVGAAIMRPITPFFQTIMGTTSAAALLATLGAAPLSSPALTDFPTAPTPIATDNSTRLATTSFVKTAIAALINGSPALLDTLKELADAIGDDPNFAATMTTALGNRLRFDAAQALSGPQLTQVRSNLGLAAVAATGAYADLTGKPVIGTAANNLVQLDGTAKLPPVDASQLTNLPGGRIVGSSFWHNQSTPPTGALIEDGASYSSTTYANLFATLVKYLAGATLTIANPGVVTWAAHGRKGNDPVFFTTTGALPTGLTAGTVYFIVPASITTNTFQVSATAGGAAIATTGAQSGVHTVVNAPHGCATNLSTFNVPNTLGEFVRGWDGGRGVDASRAMGSAQADAFKAHTHNSTWIAGGSGFAAGDGYNGGGSSATSSAGGTETRPRNVAKLPCIIYQ